MNITKKVYSRKFFIFQASFLNFEFFFRINISFQIDDRIFWKMTALPKYRQRRPGLAEPFPWEPAVKHKMEMMQSTDTTNNSSVVEYKIRYRMPFNKHKTRNVHQVAVMTPVAQPHLYYEFHFNRYGLNNTKFYACLSCRKAKTESGIRDVIRTIHLDGYKFLSNGDPFNGHHFACRPHNVYDYKYVFSFKNMNSQDKIRSMGLGKTFFSYRTHDNGRFAILFLKTFFSDNVGENYFIHFFYVIQGNTSTILIFIF